MNWVRRFVSELTGSAERELVQQLILQIDAARDGAELARRTITGELDSPTARCDMRAIEHRGDAHRERLIEKLSTALMPPFDREDIFRLSRSIDDVLDNLRDFVREADLFGVSSRAHFEEVLVALLNGLQELVVAVDSIVSDPSDVTVKALAAKKAGNRIRQLYQIALAELFEGELTMDVLKRRELLRRLDVVALRLGEAADILADGATKRSQ